ncbi:hypothetical protein BDV10DRAFT_162677 [Aspergillus recurvatus]
MGGFWPLLAGVILQIHHSNAQPKWPSWDITQMARSVVQYLRCQICLVLSLFT